MNGDVLVLLDFSWHPLMIGVYLYAAFCQQFLKQIVAFTSSKYNHTYHIYIYNTYSLITLLALCSLTQ